MLRVYQEADTRTDTYTYDHVGNRATQTLTRVQTKTFTYVYYAHSSRLMSDGRYAYVYDDAGNLVGKGNAFTIDNGQVTFIGKSGDAVEYWQYEYDVLNRLILGAQE